MLHDERDGKTYAARDPFGVRPTFIGNNITFNYFKKKKKSLN
jgi:asparagine synthetase B (glutamine-hydrolysing)